MNSLTKLEFKKIISNKAIKIACAICILIVLYAVIAGITIPEYSKPNDQEKNIEYVHGFEAIKLKKEATAKYEGYLDEKKIMDIKNYNDKIKSNKSNLNDGQISDYANSKYCQPYDDISFLIMSSYSDLNTSNITIDNFKTNSVGEFYKNRVKLIESNFNVKYSNINFSKDDKKTIINFAKNLTTPLYYEYYDGWDMLITNLFEVNVAVILILCFCITFVYLIDYQNGMITVVLTTVNGKSNLCKSKIKASIIFSSLVYTIVTILHTVLILFFYGYSGWDCPIQISSKYWLSIYNLKFYQLYLLGIIVGLCVCVFMIMCTLLFANIFKKSILTLSMSVIVLLVPALIDTSSIPKVFRYIIEISPIKILDILSTIKQPLTYNIFGSIQKGYINYLFLIVISVILIPIIYNLYRKQEI
ncbi:MAG: hypothetical protein ABF289_17480 [Clostridiales bacterium]